MITSRQEVAIEHVFYSCKDKGKMIIIIPCLLLELYIYRVLEYIHEIIGCGKRFIEFCRHADFE